MPHCFFVILPFFPSAIISTVPYSTANTRLLLYALSAKNISFLHVYGFYAIGTRLWLLNDGLSKGYAGARVRENAFLSYHGRIDAYICKNIYMYNYMCTICGIDIFLLADQQRHRLYQLYMCNVGILCILYIL